MSESPAGSAVSQRVHTRRGRRVARCWLYANLKYGRAFRQYRRALSFSQWSDADTIAEFQFRKLRTILAYAYENVVYYAQLFDRAGFDPSRMASIEDIRKIPYLTKAIVRDRGSELVSRRMPLSRLVYNRTGGTTGAPVGFYSERTGAALEQSFILCAWEWAGYRIGDRVAVLRGDMPIDTAGDRAIYRLDRRRNRIVLSSYDISRRSICQYARALQKHRPSFIHAYPSSLSLLVKYLKQAGEAIEGVWAIFTSSETLYDEQRVSIQSYFNARIHDLYGNSEQTCMAAQCEALDGYHVFPEYGFVEIIDDNGDPVCEAGRVGEIVSTSLTNCAMPFIRYRTGDMATYGAPGCGCGRQYTRLNRIVGRRQDCFVTADWDLIPLTGATDGMILGMEEDILQSQFRQHTPGLVTLLIAKEGGMTSEQERRILSALSARYGDSLRFVIRVVKHIEPTARGKHRMLVQNLPLSQEVQGRS
jgi:phenylacetate-CoA ligase